MTETVRDRLRALVVNFRSRAIGTARFCGEFETAYNLELDKRTLSRTEARAFADLFEKVVWYSPFPDEVATIPNYLGDADIRAAADRAAECLADEERDG